MKKPFIRHISKRWLLAAALVIAAVAASWLVWRTWIYEVPPLPTPVTTTYTRQEQVTQMADAADKIIPGVMKEGNRIHIGFEDVTASGIPGYEHVTTRFENPEVGNATLTFYRHNGGVWQFGVRRDEPNYCIELKDQEVRKGLANVQCLERPVKATPRTYGQYYKLTD